MTMTPAQAVTDILALQAKMHDIVHGANPTYVATESGLVPSFATMAANWLGGLGPMTWPGAQWWQGYNVMGSGTTGDQYLVFKNAAATSTTNVTWELYYNGAGAAHGNFFKLFSYDGATFQDWLTFDYISKVLTLGVPSGGLVQVLGGNFAPNADNSQLLGMSDHRWSVVYAGSGTINTSDAREKQWRGALTPTEIEVGKAICDEIGVYQFLDAIAEKGVDGARLHFGVRAQNVGAIFTAHGLDPARYGFYCYDEWPETPARPEQKIEKRDAAGVIEKDASGNNLYDVTAPAVPAKPAGNRYGVRYDELAAFLLAVMDARLKALEAA